MQNICYKELIFGLVVNNVEIAKIVTSFYTIIFFEVYTSCEKCGHFYYS